MKIFNSLNQLKTVMLILLFKSVLLTGQSGCNSSKSPIKGTGLIGQESTLLIWNPSECESSESMYHALMLNRDYRYQQLEDPFNQIDLFSPADTGENVLVSNKQVDGIKLRVADAEKDAFLIVSEDMHIRSSIIDRVIRLDSVWQTKDTTIQIKNASLCSGISLKAGDIDGDGGDEFVVAYETGSGDYKIGIFRLNQDLVPELMNSVSVINPDLKPNGLTINDFDNDGKGELVILLKDSGEDRIYLQAVDINDDYTIDEYEPQLVLDKDFINSYHEIDLTSGDYNHDRNPELALAYSITSPCNEGESFGCEDVFLYPVELKDDTITDTNDPLEKFYLAENKLISYYFIPSYGDENPSKIQLETGDLNGDGIEELVLGAKEVHIIQLDENLSLKKDIKVKTLSDYYSEYFKRPVSLGDINGDNITDLTVVNYNLGTVGVESYFEVGYYGYDSEFNVNWSEYVQPDNGYIGTCKRKYSVLTGFFSGFQFRIDSCGIHKRREQISDPVLILNAPPVHFDVIDNETYDINNVFLQDNDDYFVEYTTKEENSTASLISTTTSGDWGFQPEISVHGEASYNDFVSGFFSFSLENEESETNEFFSKSSKSEEISTKTSQSSVDDAILALVTDYETWEHNVYDKNDRIIGKIVAVRQEEPDFEWMESRTGLNKGLYLQHEFGNILSYPYFDEPDKNDPRIGKFIGYGGRKINLGIGLDNEVELKWNEYLEESESIRHYIAEKPTSFGLDVMGVAGKLAGTLGIEVEDGSLAEEENISTMENTLSTETRLMIKVGRVENSERSYSVEPYFYWSTSGALVVDYIVEPDLSTGTWWMNHYGQQPDPAFILPFHLDTAKGIVPYQDESLYQQTSSIFFSPAIPDDADTVTIIAKINNYSLISTGEPASVSFYYNDPTDENNRIEDIDGKTVFYTGDEIAERNYDFVSLRWIIPDQLRNSNTKIYAVIDPENEMDEIHEENNIGWSYLFKLRSAELPGTMVDPRKKMKKYPAASVYPNPVYESANISCELEQKSDIKIELISGSGQMIEVLDEETEQSPGEYNFKVNTGKYPTGIYFIRIITNQQQEVLKLIKN